MLVAASRTVADSAYMLSEEAFIYTSHSLHIEGEKSSSPRIRVDCSAYELSHEEAKDFLVRGYFLLASAVDSETILEARLFIDRNYHRWLGIEFVLLTWKS